MIRVVVVRSIGNGGLEEYEEEERGFEDEEGEA